MRCDGEKLRKLRQKVGYPQNELADKANLSVGTIRRAESGESIATDSCRKLSVALGTDIEAIILTEPTEPPIGHSLTEMHLGAMTIASLTRRDFFVLGVATGIISNILAVLGIRAYDDYVEKREFGRELLFRGSNTNYYRPSTNNPYSRVTGITLPTRDALASVFQHLGFTRDRFESVDDPCVRSLDGSLLLLGGPVANMFSRQILGVGTGSWLFSRAQGKNVTLPIAFENIPAGKVRGGVRPHYRVTVQGHRSFSRLDDPDADFLLLTSIPNIFSRSYGVFDHRIMIVAGLHGAGTRSIDLVLQEPKLLDELIKRTKSYSGWQALIRVDKLDPTKEKPLQLGERAVVEITNVNFDRAHEMVQGSCFWLDPSDTPIEI